MAKTYIPILLANIDQGEFLDSIDADLAETHRGLAAYIERHGDEAEGAKAELIVKLTFKVENAKDGVVSVKGTTKVGIPNRPPSVSMAMTEEDDDGPGLFVKRSGSEAASPRQSALATQDGRTVDPETGEVKEEAKVP